MIRLFAYYHHPTGAYASEDSLTTYREYVNEGRAKITRARRGFPRQAAVKNQAYWCHMLAVAAAAIRAKAGDHVAARRIEWLTAVVEERHHVDWLVKQWKQHDTTLRRLLDAGASEACGCCAKRLAQERALCEDYTQEITSRVATPAVETWAEWKRSHPVEGRSVARGRLRVIVGGRPKDGAR